MKKLIFSLMMICMIVMSSGVVWADLIPIGPDGERWYLEEPTLEEKILDSELVIMVSLIFVIVCVIVASVFLVKKQKNKKSENIELQKGVDKNEK